MPASPGLSTSVVAGSTGHIADTNAVHALLNSIFKMPLGTPKAGAYTLLQSDTGSTIPVNSASSVPITVPVLEAGTRLRILRVGSGAVTFVSSGGTVLSGPSGATLTPKDQGSLIELLYLTTTDVRFTGDLTGTGGGSGGGSTVERVKYTGSATMAAADGGKVIDVDVSAPATFTVPPRSTVPQADGTVAEIVALGTGQVSIAPGAGVQFIPAGTWKLREQGAGAKIRALPIGDASLPTAGLLLRYAADDVAGANGAAVTSWPESSGLGHPAAVPGTVAPTVITNAVNGHRAVAFNGTTQFMRFVGSALNVARNRGHLGVYVCYRYPTAVAGVRTILALSSGASTTLVRNVLYHRDSTGFLGAGGRRLDGDSGQFLVGSQASVAGAVEVAAAQFDYTNSDARLFKDGTQIAESTTFQTAGSTSDTASLEGSIGSNLAGNAEFCNLHLLEILFYSSGDATTRANVNTYFESKFGANTSDGNGATGDVWNIQGDIIL